MENDNCWNIKRIGSNKDKYYVVFKKYGPFKIKHCFCALYVYVSSDRDHQRLLCFSEKV